MADPRPLSNRHKRTNVRADIWSEATWGADPLEYQGGFRALEYDAQTRYKSSLTNNGVVSWSLQKAIIKEAPGQGKLALEVGFPKVDWAFLTSIYGWAALQYQAWARGTIILDSHIRRTVILYTENVLEFWIDNNSYFGGDVYAYRRSPLVLQLDPGPHRIDIRLVRDVRSLGGLREPTIRIELEAQVSKGGLVALRDKLVVSDIVDGQLASPLASIPLRNEDQTSICVWSVRSFDDSVNVAMIDNLSLVLIAGQSRPLPFMISLRDRAPSSFSFVVDYSFVNDQEHRSTQLIHYQPKQLTIFDPHKFSFLHPSGIVSYAILRPPSLETCTKRINRTFPIMLGLHGAGLDADSDLVRHTLDLVPHLCAWVLFPNGVTPWSGDDWHNWGFADVEAAITAIPVWMDNVRWQGANADVQRWLVIGHSNGGQGTWFIATHRPHNVIAAAPVSGYLSISTYVPYQFWQEVDPRLNSILQSAMNDYKHELLVHNLVGIPIMQQHGSTDDNVPAYHSRRMSQLMFQTGWASEYNELPNQGHWFEGVMTTPALREFYRHALATSPNRSQLCKEFALVVANAGNIGPKCGLEVDQLESPDQYGRVEVKTNGTVWSIKTSNIHSFHLTPASCSGLDSVILLIDNELEQFRIDCRDTSDVVFSRSVEGLWRRSDASSGPKIVERSGRQLGSLDAILNTHGRFCVVRCGHGTLGITLQIARNLFQYFGADVEIVDAPSTCVSHQGTVIRVVLSSNLLPSLLERYPITIEASRGILIRDVDGKERVYGLDPMLAALFLRPLESEALELVVWGSEEAGLRQAARLVPMLTGVGQPDFIILGKECSWKGVNGVKAMGFFDHAWNVSKASFFA
ncbi:MAG: hypothetical protein M1836_002971 [Candelina mexicana]|nr:MAG: hypothetical protein M1836_002971 [Candelina mexicana]